MDSWLQKGDKPLNPNQVPGGHQPYYAHPATGETYGYKRPDLNGTSLNGALGVVPNPGPQALPQGVSHNHDNAGGFVPASSLPRAYIPDTPPKAPAPASNKGGKWVWQAVDEETEDDEVPSTQPPPLPIASTSAGAGTSGVTPAPMHNPNSADDGNTPETEVVIHLKKKPTKSKDNPNPKAKAKGYVPKTPLVPPSRPSASLEKKTSPKIPYTHNEEQWILMLWMTLVYVSAQAKSIPMSNFVQYLIREAENAEDLDECPLLPAHRNEGNLRSKVKGLLEKYGLTYTIHITDVPLNAIDPRLHHFLGFLYGRGGSLVSP